MFDNKSLSLTEIGKIIKELPMPKKRKYTLNFAVTSKSNLDVDLMNKYCQYIGNVKKLAINLK